MKSTGISNTTSPKNRIATTKVIVAIILTLIGILGSLKLNLSGIISEPSFDLFITLSVFVGLFIAYSDRVKSFNLRDFKMEFEKVKAARKEIEDIEQSIHQVALTLAEISMFIAAFGRRATNPENEKMEVAWLSSKASQLLAEITATSDEKDFVFRHMKSLAKLDELLKNNPKEGQKLWNEIWHKISQEIEKPIHISN